MNEIEIKQIPGDEAKIVVKPLYHNEGNGISIRDTDLFFVGYVDGIVAASVRYCVEFETPMLRTMRVRKKFQRRGLGLKILQAFEEYLESNNVRGTHCLPYSHLEKFYGNIGFVTVADDQVPQFLQERLAENRANGMRVLCMRRK